MAKSGKVIETKLLKEKWEYRVQLVRGNGENGVGVSITITALASVGRVRVRMAWNDMLLMGVVYGDVEMNENRDDGS